VKPIALILTISLIALIGFGCAPPPPPQALRATAAVCDGGVLNTVPFLKVPFEPSYKMRPEPDYDAPTNPEIQADLTAAFQAAPPFFRAQLCGLQGIYINPAGCSGFDPSTCGSLSEIGIADNSWGFREPSRGDKYIALSLGLWKDNRCTDARSVCAAPFKLFETRRLLALLARTAEPAEKDSRQTALGDRLPRLSPPSFEVSPDTPAMSVLAALAHEFGHVLWWDTFVQPPGSVQGPNTAAFCDGSFYPSGAWQGRKVTLPDGRWVGFGDIRLQPDNSDVLLFSQSLRSANYARAFDGLHRIYSNGRWASALAAFSPDEDFVESFQRFFLLNAGLQQTAITSGKYSDSVVRNGNVAPLVQTKLQCFARLYQPAKR